MAPNNFVIFNSAEILTFAQELYKRTHVGGRNTEAEMPWDELIWIDSKSRFISKLVFSGVTSRVRLWQRNVQISWHIRSGQSMYENGVEQM